MFVNSNIVNQIVTYYDEKLSALYPSNEVKNITEMMFEHFMGWDKMTLRSNNKSSLSESELLLFHKTLKRLLKNVKVTYSINIGLRMMMVRSFWEIGTVMAMQI